MIRRLDVDVAPPGGRPVDLVFRTVGERTSEVALDLAIRGIRPNAVHIVDNVRPWAEALARMHAIDHRCSHVVYVDADCLILEDLRPFLDANELAYVDCYVQDRYRGRVHAGVHITRADLVLGMRGAAPDRDLAYALSPEAQIRRGVLAGLQRGGQRKTFHILHDHFQHPVDVFRKYALRELRSRRAEPWGEELAIHMSEWGDAPDYDAARAGVRHARESIAPGTPPEEQRRYVDSLPETARAAVAAMGLDDLPTLTVAGVHAAMTADPEALGPPPRPAKVFGVGLPHHNWYSLVNALYTLGVDVACHPVDRGTLDTLARGDGRFPLLDHYDGLVDLAVLPCLAELDALHPGARFVLMVHPTEDWVDRAGELWMPEAPANAPVEEREVYAEVQHRLHMCVYGCTELDRDRLARVHADAMARIRAHFAGRPDDLLVIDIGRGDGLEGLAPFLGCRRPPGPFPRA